MNNGAYQSNKPDVVGPKVAEVVAHELGVESVPFEIEMSDAEELGARTALNELRKHLFGGTLTRIYTVCFELAKPRPMTLHVHVDRMGVGARLGSVLFSTNLSSKGVKSEAMLEDPKTFGSSKFVGEAFLVDKLNANKDLIKRAGKFARTEWLETKAPRMFKVMPEEGGATLVAVTLPRSYSMGFKVALDVVEFAELAALIEAAL